MKPSHMSDEQYALFFDVRRSIRYHDRRRAFFETLHRLTGALTVLLAGSVLFDIARPGDNPAWLLALAAIAAVLSAFDLVAGYSSRANRHADLKRRFVALESGILAADADDATWQDLAAERLAIETDEPPIYRALDVLCHNELARAEGISDTYRLPAWAALTAHLFHWPNIAAHIKKQAA